VVGSHAAVVNVDYRFPSGGSSVVPARSAVRPHAARRPVCRFWTCLERQFDLQDVRASLGGELSCDAVLGYVLPITFSMGVAWVSEGRGAVAFGRIGHAF
jgi:hypothetical protein